MADSQGLYQGAAKAAANGAGPVPAPGQAPRPVPPGQNF